MFSDYSRDEYLDLPLSLSQKKFRFLSDFEETALNSQDKYTILDSICPGSSEILHRMTKKEEYQRKTAKNN